MQKLLTNVGSADEIRGEVLSALGDSARLSLVLDKPRTLMIRSVRMSESMMTVRLHDVNDDTTVVLVLPYGSRARAQAEITKFGEESEDA